MRGKAQRSGGQLPDLGLRRVSWVRVSHDGPTPRCVVAGIRNRRPVVVPVPLSTAAALAAAGVPMLLRPRSAPAPAASVPPAEAVPAVGDA